MLSLTVNIILKKMYKISTDCKISLAVTKYIYIFNLIFMFVKITAKNMS